MAGNLVLMAADEPVDRWKPQPASGRGGPDLDDHSDQLPAELDAAGFVGPYLFPDIKRRRIAGWMYLAVGIALLLIWGARHGGGVLVDDGFLVGGIVGVLVGLYHHAAGYPLAVRDLEALTAASAEVGFPVGHASAQLGWRGMRSRPTWRILLYSAEDPPASRGLVLVDGVDGAVVGHFVEDNPEDWSQL